MAFQRHQLFTANGVGILMERNEDYSDLANSVVDYMSNEYKESD